MSAIGVKGNNLFTTAKHGKSPSEETFHYYPTIHKLVQIAEIQTFRHE